MLDAGRRGEGGMAKVTQPVGEEGREEVRPEDVCQFFVNYHRQKEIREEEGEEEEEGRREGEEGREVEGGSGEELGMHIPVLTLAAVVSSPPPSLPLSLSPSLPPSLPPSLSDASFLSLPFSSCCQEEAAFFRPGSCGCAPALPPLPPLPLPLPAALGPGLS